MPGANTRISRGKVLKRFHMFIPEKAKDELQKAAAREGYSLKDYLLAGAYERLRRRPVLKAEEAERLIEATDQLHRVGRNFNMLLQASFFAEMSKRPPPLAEDYELTRNEVMAILNEFRSILSEFYKWQK